MTVSTSFGDYTLHSVIAEGGMGQVFLASRSGVEGFRKHVALKCLHPHLTHDLQFVSMFIDEAKLAAQLHHPNIVQVYDLGAVQGRYFIAMEYIDGVDLGTVLREFTQRGERLPVALAIGIIIELLYGLHYAHSKKDTAGAPLHLVHRDISPQNVLLSREGLIKLTDFGIAKVASRSIRTATGLLRGRLEYMAPEQANAQTVDFRADLFAAGALLYELLSGQLMRQNGNDTALLDEVRAGQLPPFDIVPQVFVPMLTRALAFAPEDRFADAASMAEALAVAQPEARLRTHEAVARLLQTVPLPVLKAIHEQSARPVATDTSHTPAARPVAPPKRWAFPFLPVLLLVLAGLTIAVAIRVFAPVQSPVQEPMAASLPLEVSAVSPTPPAIAATGYLSVNARPWARVMIDGKLTGRSTPIHQLPLVAGPHHIKLISPRAGQDIELTVEIEAGKTLTKVFTFK